MRYMYKKSDILNSFGIFFIIFGNVGSVRLDFREMRLEHRHLTMNSLAREFSIYYKNQCKNKILNILASSDFLGNPNELIRHIREGLFDLVTLSGELSMIGLFRGMTSFFHHSVYGASNSMYRFFESIKNGMNTMILDENRERRIFSKVFMSATRAALLVPNLFFSMASSTANNIRDAVEQPNHIKRKRPPRSFLSSRVLSTYSYSESVGQYVLSMVEHGKYLNEGITYHVYMDDNVIVVTSKRILCALVEESKALWQIMISSITLIKQAQESLQIFFLMDKDIGFKQEIIEISGVSSELDKLKQVLTVKTVQI